MAFDGTFLITDGTTTVDFSGSNVSASGATMEYAPQPFRGTDTTLAEVGIRAVQETARVRFRGISASAAIDTARALERLLDQAARFRESERGNRIYVKFKPESAETLYRAEVYKGDVSWDRQKGLGDHLRGKMFAVDVQFNRGVWEADSEVELALTNGSAANQTGGLTIFNHDDATATHDNYVEIAGSAVGGVEPAPCRIEITNLGATSITSLYLGLNAFSPSMPIHVLEGENASGAASVADANSSSGAYGVVSVSASISASRLGWNIPAASANKFGGQEFHLLLRIPGSASTNNGIYCFAAAQYVNSATVLAVTNEVQMSGSGIQSLGTLMLPPYLKSEADYLGFDLRLHVRKTTTASLYCDYLMLMGADAFRFYSASAALGQNATLKDEASVTGRVWVDGISGTARSAHFADFGNPVYLIPGKTQRLYVVAMDSTNMSVISNTFKVRVYYRPRRWTL